MPQPDTVEHRLRQSHAMLADQSLALCCILFGKTQLQVHIGNALAAARPIQEQVHHPPQNHSQAAPYAQRQVRQHLVHAQRLRPGRGTAHAQLETQLDVLARFLAAARKRMNDPDPRFEIVIHIQTGTSNLNIIKPF